MAYAGFWPRLWALLIDLVALSPLIWLSYWTFSHSRTTALIFEVPIAALFALYNIYFVGRWGQTVGKMALKIKVVALDGSNAGFLRAFYRHSVDLGFSIIGSFLTLYALSSIAPHEFDALGFKAKMDVLAHKTPSWKLLLDDASYAWTLSELVVLLLNKKRRALHDFLAGTVVVHTEAKPVGA